MAKKSQRHPIRYDKDQAGCIWGFISFFDFRYGRSTRKRLLDRRRQNVGARYSPSKLHMRKNSNGDPQEIYDGKERDTPIADDARTSVKDLMEEEMFSEQEKNKQTSNAGIEAKESDPGHSGRLKKNHKRTSKSSKSSCDINYELDAAENLGPDNSRRHDSEEQNFKNFDMEVLLNEICQQIYQNNDLDIQSIFDEKFVEAIKVFVDQRFTNGKIDRSKEFTDILQTLSSNKELILKLLKDPNSLSMKQFDNLEDGQSEKDQNSNSSATFNLLGGELNNSKPSEPVARKPHNFFRRKSKSQEKIVLNGDENCQNSSRIVILKPGPQSVQISETEMKLSSSPQAHHDLGTKVQTEKIASQFSFTKIKRKLKNAMGKERHGSHSNDQNMGYNDKGVGREKGGWNSPNRNHFYNERFARPAIGVKNKENNCKLKDTETSSGNETVDFAKLRVSNIYVEAKKHLSEMLSNGDEIEDFSSQQLPKSLGRILSLPEFNLSPVCSPRRDNANTGQLTQENHVSHLSPSQQDLNDQSCISDNPEDMVQSCNANSDVLDELARANAVEETSCSMRPEKSCEGDVEILETYELVLEEIEIVEIGIMDISAEQCSSSIIGDERNGDLPELCDEDESAPCLKLDSFEQDQLLSSSLTSPPSSSITEHVEDLDSTNERSERPSPVSVLEPLFTEDDISPARIKSQTVEPPMQPLQIHFEERMICATSREICISTCMEDEESAFEYVEAVLLASDLNWEEFLLRWLSSDQTNYYSCPRFIAPTIKSLSSISSLHTRKTTPLFPVVTVSLSIFAFKRSRELGSSSVYIERERQVEKRESPMTISPAVRISDRKLVVKDRAILTDVPDNVLATSGSSSGPVEGVFLGAVLEEEKSRHVVSLGKLRDVRFLACFRFKLWWMAQRMGDQGREIPLETQFLLLETKDGSHLESDGGNQNDQIVYTVFLPLIEGSFRACLQGNDARDELELCLESGDSETTSSVFTHSVYVSAGTDPFATITDAIRAVKSHLKTFRQRHEKKLPGIVDYFGWCTWDAFYQEVTQEGVEAGLSSLASGGSPPKFVIIDDGWQSVGGDKQPQPSDQAPLLRLTAIKENAKFKNKEDPGKGIENIVKIAKEKYGLRHVYVWHAITGYWGGVRPGEAEMEEYGSLMKYPKVSKGVVENEPGWKSDALAVQGLGLVQPKKVYEFYNELHGYLSGAGVDGVKVDAQCILETLGGGLGGRVELTRMYHQALDASVASHFPDNGIIACMSHNTDALYCSKQTAVVRASDDFFPRDPVSHTIHIAAVAYNTFFLGEFMLPDWDMFHSLHPAAEYHASARAISGGPVYVSDAPGKHNFDLLKKLVLPDGSILRAQLPGRPTKDCLFSDPARDGVSLLKIWNMNKYTGVLGVYNCQGAAWNTIERKNTFHQTGSEAITGLVRGCDVHLIGDVAMDPEWNGDSAIYSHGSGELITLPSNAAMPISLKVLEHDIFTVTPIKVLAPGFNFAPLGLIDMFNAGGAIEALKYEVKGGARLCELEDGYRGEGNELAGERVENLSGELVAMVRMEVKGCGRFGAYSSAKPRKCTVGLTMVEFEYDSVSGLVTLNLDHMPEEDKKFHIVEVEL